MKVQVSQLAQSSHAERGYTGAEMRSPATWPRRRSSLEGFEERGRVILEAAADEFCKKGYDDASISSIARSACVSDSVIYKHVESKEHLLYEAIGWRYETVVRQIVDEVNAATGAEERIRLFIHLHLRSWAQTPQFNLLYFHETRRPPHRYSHLINVHSAIFLRCLEDVLRQGIAAGLFKSNLKLRFVRDFVIGGLDHSVWWTGALGKSIDVDALADQALRLVLRGISASPTLENPTRQSAHKETS